MLGMASSKGKSSLCKNNFARDPSLIQQMECLSQLINITFIKYVNLMFQQYHLNLNTLAWQASHKTRVLPYRDVDQRCGDQAQEQDGEQKEERRK